MQIPRANSKAMLDEAVNLAKTIVDDAENDRVPVALIALKAARLALFQGDTENESRLQTAAKDLTSGEEALRQTRLAAEAARKGNNPFDWAWTHEQAALGHAKLIADWKAWIHSYASSVYHESRLGNLASSVFDRVRMRVDPAVAKYLPDSAKKLSSAYENLRSQNAQDWANAVHTCRRLLKDLADAVNPATDDPKYTDDKYINRLVAFVVSRTGSETFARVVGAQINYLGNRLFAIYNAANKGSHADVDQEEADRYVLYTYLFIGDVLSLTSGQLLDTR
jgi:hypothetical protein